MRQPPDDLTPSSSCSDEEPAEEQLPLSDLDMLLARPPSRRKRLVQLALVLGAVAIVLATFWNTLVPTKPSAPPVTLRIAMPPPTIQIQSNVSYGSLSINGHPQSGTLPLILHLGTQPPYTVTLSAPPFRSLTCQFPPRGAVSPTTANPCLASGMFISTQQAVDTLTMLLTLGDLPPAQQQQITALLPQAITAQQVLTVPAHSHIITGLNADGTVTTQVVSSSLQASISLIPSTPSSQTSLPTFCESFLCYTTSIGFPSGVRTNGHLWEVSTPIALRLRSTAANGQVVSDVTFSSSTLLDFWLSYDAAAGWQALPASGNPDQLNQLICSTGAQMLLVEQARYLSGEGWGTSTLNDQGVEGCVLKLTQNNVDQGHFLWRFGALLAADAKAHSTFPLLPVASPAELAAAGGG